GERTELHFERGYQHADHRAAEYLRRQGDLVDRSDDAHIVRRISADPNDIGIGGPHRAHHRREVRRLRRLAFIVSQLQAVLLYLVARAVVRGARELGVGGWDVAR